MCVCVCVCVRLSGCRTPFFSPFPLFFLHPLSQVEMGSLSLSIGLCFIHSQLEADTANDKDGGNALNELRTWASKS